MENVKSRYYTIEDIKILEHCGKNKAYEIAKSLPHETRGKNQIFVFSEAYDQYYEDKKSKAIKITGTTNADIFTFRKIK